MTDDDSPWKEVLERYFAAFTTFLTIRPLPAIESKDTAFLDYKLLRNVHDVRLERA